MRIANCHCIPALADVPYLVQCQTSHNEGPRRSVCQRIFFRTESGGEPVRAWLLSLSQGDRKRIGEHIKTVEFGWPVGMPTCRSLGGGLHEVRTNLDQNRIARVIFYI